MCVRRWKRVPEPENSVRPAILSAVVVGLAAILAAGASYYRTTSSDVACRVAREGDALQWMKVEFQLTEAQYAAIAQAHEEQSSACAQHCEAVSTARERVEKLRGHADAAALARAEAEAEKLEEVCERSVEAHVRRVAALMPAAQGERYLAMVLPRLQSLTHTGPPDLRLDH